jgi:hypothetical protein
VRLSEHGLKVAHVHEDLCLYLRELRSAGTPWDFEVLRECSEDEHVPDAERWEVIRRLRAGHDPRNMLRRCRHGEELSSSARSFALSRHMIPDALLRQILRRTTHSAVTAKSRRARPLTSCLQPSATRPLPDASCQQPLGASNRCFHKQYITNRFCAHRFAATESSSMAIEFICSSYRRLTPLAFFVLQATVPPTTWGRGPRHASH